MGELFAKHFVSAHQQVGDFKVVKVGDRVKKNGGNVASHFLTPQGQVIHSVTGPVSPSVLLSEANWALEKYSEAKRRNHKHRAEYLAAAHHQASLTPASSQDRKVHELLSLRPLPHLQSVYVEVFEKILGQKVSEAGPRLAKASVRLQYAAKTGRPLLFILHEGTRFTRPPLQGATQSLIDEFVVIIMPLREAPALSQLTKQPPFAGSGSGGPLIVITRSDCVQLTSVSGWKERELQIALARGWADALEQRPPSTGALVRAQRVLRKADQTSADRIKNLTIEVQAKAKAERDAEREKARRASTRLAAK